MTTDRRHSDVTIVGGGLAGLTLAVLLARGAARDSLRVDLLDTQPPLPLSAADELDLRVSALSPASRALLERAGVWSKLPASHVAACRAMWIWQGSGGRSAAHALHFEAAAAGVSELGYIVENNALRHLLWEAAEHAGVQLHCPAAPTALEVGAEYALLRAGATEWQTRLVVGADGGRSWVREQLGIDLRARSYGQTGIVAHVQTELPHGDTAFQRFLPDGPVALLPLADGRSSLVWSCADETAAQRLATTAADFADQLTSATESILGRVLAVSARAGFPLAMAQAGRVAGARFALIGDAAHRIHPLAGQGINLGLQDAAVLASRLLEHSARPLADPGDPLVLRRFARERAGHNQLTMLAMDGLHRLFDGPAELAGAGMGLVNRSAWLKASLARYAMGAR